MCIRDSSRGVLMIGKCKPLFVELYERYSQQPNPNISCADAIVDFVNNTITLVSDRNFSNYSLIPIDVLEAASSVFHLLTPQCFGATIDPISTLNRVLDLVVRLNATESCPSQIRERISDIKYLVNNWRDWANSLPFLSSAINMLPRAWDSCIPCFPTTPQVRKILKTLSSSVNSLYEEARDFFSPWPYNPSHTIDQRLCERKLVSWSTEFTSLLRTEDVVSILKHLHMTIRLGRPSILQCRDYVWDIKTTYAQQKNRTIGCSHAIYDALDGIFSISYLLSRGKHNITLLRPLGFALAGGIEIGTRCIDEIRNYYGEITYRTLQLVADAPNCVGRGLKIGLDVYETLSHGADFNYIIMKLAQSFVDAEALAKNCLKLFI
eukprot:TRINITY_DN4963_c0_g1_i2.p1 TRINITY_DN4963_c0_g1~~TRINITY_DN4963_c0_g1_i2.p1  ORF type:complete len:394 (-),score=52.25 TRINITY_DN4963_c0_g1_i2:257-1393(-)